MPAATFAALVLAAPLVENGDWLMLACHTRAASADDKSWKTFLDAAASNY